MNLAMSLLLFFGACLANAFESNENQQGQCMKIMELCKSAGFTGTSKQNTNLYKDCFQPLLEGRSVAGVSVPASDLSACKAKRESSRKKDK